MQWLAIQNLLKCTGTLQIFIDPHWYFILDTRLMLRSIKLFFYIQTQCSKFPVVRSSMTNKNDYGRPEIFFYPDAEIYSFQVL